MPRCGRKHSAPAEIALLSAGARLTTDTEGFAMIDLHYWPTPNGKKVTILLEEAGVEYKIIPCNIQRGDQFTPDFLKMNPNHRMPLMVDHAPKGGGAPISVFELGTTLMETADK